MRAQVAVILAGGFLLFTCGSCNEEGEALLDVEETGSSVDVRRSTVTVREVLAANEADHGDPADYVWDTSLVVPILLSGSSITETSDSVAVDGTRVTILSGGTYSVSGSLTNGQIVVNTTDAGVVRLILNGVTISNTTTSPLYVASAAKVVVILADNTRNELTDGTSYVFAEAGATEPNAAVFSKSDMTITGNGTLTVRGNYNDAIGSKDGLIISGATVTVTAVDDGIRGKDYLVLRNAHITVISTGDGLKADNDEDVARGYISVESGSVTVNSGGDAIAAATDAVIAGGTIALTSGGGSSRTVTGTTSAKGIKGTVSVVIGDGTFSISSADDAVHSNALVVVNGGTFDISAADDGMHADSLLGVNGGTIVMTKCYEGLESTALVINDGTIRITSSDDGLNGAGGNDGSGAPGWPGSTIPSSGRILSVNGGYVAIAASGDGVDVNGSITMTGGTILVHGPTSNANGAIDYDASFKMTGGVLVAAGSSGMAQAPNASSTQCAILVKFSTTKAGGTLFHVQGADGTDILTYRPAKAYQSVAFCSPRLVKGSAYEVYLGGSSTGTVTDGLYEGGTYSGGTRSTSFTISGTVTNVSG